jgi:hypothetical protein
MAARTNTGHTLMQERRWLETISVNYAQATPLTACSRCTVRVFRHDFTLEDAIGSQACSLEANMRVANSIPLGRPPPLTVHTVNSVQTLKGCSNERDQCCNHSHPGL